MQRAEYNICQIANLPTTSADGPADDPARSPPAGIRMEQAERDLLADLRRARRSLRLQGMDQPTAVARLTLGQRIADAVATVMGSWTFIIVQSAILFVWITPT